MEGPRQAHQRAAVADVALHLAGDRRDSERGELVAAARVVAVDGVEEADRARLEQVVELRARAPVPAGQRLDEGQVELTSARGRGCRRGRDMRPAGDL